MFPLDPGEIASGLFYFHSAFILTCYFVTAQYSEFLFGYGRKVKNHVPDELFPCPSIYD